MHPESIHFFHVLCTALLQNELNSLFLQYIVSIETIPHNGNVKEVCLKSLQMY